MRTAKVDSGKLLLGFIVLLLAGGIGLAVFSFRADNVERALTGDRVINTLFVIEKDNKPLNAYVLMYYPATRRAAVFDIPGPVGRLIPSINRVDRIDSVYDPRRITPFQNEIERLLGVEITFSFVITLENLGRITDLLEGVEVFIPAPVNEYHEGFILFPSGITFLDGDKAMTYITYELPEENPELVNARRQHFFTRLIRRLGEQNQHLNNPQVAQLFHSLLRSGVNQRTQTRLFDEFAQINTDRLSIQAVRGNVREVSGQPLVIPHWDGQLIREIVRQTIGGLVRTGDQQVDRVFTVEILNGTSVSGLAGRTAELFRSFGYDVVFLGNADRNDYEQTLLVDRSGYQEMVRAFAELIRCRNIRFDSPEQANPEEIDITAQNFEYRADFTLILGRDFNGRYVTN